MYTEHDDFISTNKKINKYVRKKNHAPSGYRPSYNPFGNIQKMKINYDYYIHPRAYKRKYYKLFYNKCCCEMEDLFL